MKKNTILAIFCFGLVLSSQALGITLIHTNVNTDKKTNLGSTPKTSTIIIEDSSEFSEGTMENLTISNNGYLMLDGEFPAQLNWINMNPSTKPSAREFHSMAYDSTHDKVILFGGRKASGRDDETWAYDLDTNTWTYMNPPTKPSARYAHSMVYDSEHDKVILFGGSFASTTSDETWAYDLDTNTWTNMAPSTKPSVRAAHSMAYDSIHDKTILFGGTSGGGETWAYDLDTNTWTNMNPFTKPSAREFHSMAYDSTHDKVILLGGYPYDDKTWAYDLDTYTWTNMNPSTNPPTRSYHSMAYDSIHDNVILFGGYDASGRDDETWSYELDTNSWTNMAPSTKPSARVAHSMAYDSTHDKVILFGGNDGTFDDETWVFRLFNYQQTGMFNSGVIRLDGNHKFTGEILWSPENQTVGTNLTVQIGYSNTMHDEDFTYTSPENSSFTFEGSAPYFRYRVNFESTTNNGLMFSPILEEIMIVYSTEIESIQNIIFIDESESEGDTIVGEDNLLEIILISCLIGVVSVLAIITILNKKKINLLEKHSKLTGRDLKSKRADKIK